MVHGACSSSGCYSMTDEQIERDLRLRPRRLPGRPDRVPDRGLSVPHDRRQHGALPQRPELSVLADAEGRLRPLRGHQGAAEGRRLREALRLQPGGRAAARPSSPTGACPADHAAGAGDAPINPTRRPTRPPSPGAVEGERAGAEAVDPGIKEAKVVSDWTRKRARGERVPIEPPSMQGRRLGRR